MNILIVGSGGREHAIAWKLAQSEKLGNLYIAPGNAGTEAIGKNLNIGVSDFIGIKAAVLKNNVNIVIVGPEVPLVEGIHDFFLADEQLKEVSVIGPEKYAAQLEGSKEFAKEFMEKHQIPTAAYKSFTKDDLEEGFSFLNGLNPPFVLKADGLAAGKGVVILEDLQEAKDELADMLTNEKFGDASSTVVIEEFLNGIEMSCFILTDGTSYVNLPSAKDYKRIGEGDVGLNTGGMGAISPVPFASEDLLQKIEDQVIKRTVDGLQKDGISYKGFIFFGLIIVNGEPMVIEYNCRMGDPETEVVMPRIKSDLLGLIVATANNKLNSASIEIDDRSATTVMLVSGGYPEAYEKGKVITGIENAEDSIVFHAGTSKDDEGNIITNGGRVIAVTSYGNDFRDALATSYRNVEKIQFKKKNFRTDIGFDL